MNWSWIWLCDQEVKGSKSNYRTPEIPSHFCLNMTSALMKTVVSYCIQPGRPATQGELLGYAPFRQHISSLLLFQTRYSSFFRKEVSRSWEGSCEHKIYNPILGTMHMLSIWKYWVISKWKIDYCTSFIHGLSTTDIWYSRFMPGSWLMPPLASLLFAGAAVLSQLRVTHTCTQANSGWQNANAQGKNMNSSASESFLVPFFLVHVAVWWQRPSLCARKTSIVGKYCDTCGQGVLLELDFGWEEQRGLIREK